MHTGSLGALAALGAQTTISSSGLSIVLNRASFNSLSYSKSTASRDFDRSEANSPPRTIGSSEASTAPCELLVKKLKKTAPDPRFIVQRERVLKRYQKGLTILAAEAPHQVYNQLSGTAEGILTTLCDDMRISGNASASHSTASS
jgi:hypothetical protein